MFQPSTSGQGLTNRRSRVDFVDSTPFDDHEITSVLRDVGFSSGYRGYTLGRGQPRRLCLNPPTSIDEILTRIQALSRQLSGMPESHPDRGNIEAEREELRLHARSLSNSARHPRSIETEIEMLESRLAVIEKEFVTKGYAEKRLTQGFSDPGAYSAGINALLAKGHAPEIEHITRRLAELRSIDPQSIDP